jgi:hypothetical protein
MHPYGLYKQVIQILLALLDKKIGSFCLQQVLSKLPTEIFLVINVRLFEKI